MANTYTQIHIQVVFAVKYREALIRTSWSDRLYKYIKGIVQQNGHKMLQINGMPDHIHIFFGLRPKQSISHLIQQVKADSTKWINREQLTEKPFQWQNGYGAFSYTKAEAPRVIQYIKSQEEHYRKKNFINEYTDLLIKHEIKYDKRYVFHPVF